MADLLWTFVRLLHIGSAITLVGGATLWNAVLAPTFAQMGPTLPRGFLPTVGGRVVKVLPHSAMLTLLTGAALFYGMQGFASELWRTMMGFSLVVMLVAVGVSYGVLVPTFRRLVKAMGAAGPPGPEAMALQRRMKLAGMSTLGAAWLLVVVMVVATALRTT